MDWREAEREYTDEVVGRTTLSRMFEAAVERHEHRPAQQYKGGVYDRSLAGSVLPAAPPGEFRSLSYERMQSIVARLATGFRELGVRADDRVGIFAHTRMEWAQADFGILAAGGVVTTVYPGSSERQVRYLLGDAGATGVVVENEQLLERVLAVEDDLDLSFVVVIDDLQEYDDREDVHTLAEVHQRGEDAFDPERYESWIDERDVEDLSSLIYTSGTTGKPKGVRLTHWNFRSNVNQCRKRFGPRPDLPDSVDCLDEASTTVSYLPLAHVLERLAGHFLLFASGATVAYAESPDTLREDFQLVQPTSATSVPRVYEKIYEAIQQQSSESLFGFGESIFEWAVGVARRYDRADSPGLGLRTRHAIADRLVFSSVRENLGGNVEFLISGGGTLSPELARLYRAMGLPMLEGYGLTETSPVIAANPPGRAEVGTVGPTLTDVDAKLDTEVGRELEPDHGGEVGELLVDGPNVTDGYWQLPEETEASFTEEGFFRTGDVVERRPDGYLVFRERAKELLVLSTGKNVAPAPLEGAFATNQFVQQAMAVGDGQKFVAALLVPDLEQVRRWADEEGIALPEDPEAVCENEQVRDRIEREVQGVNEGFETHEQIKRFRLVPEEWTEENDLLTPTMKKKRRNILDRYGDRVEEMYDE